MMGCAKMGMDFSIGCPEEYKPDEKIVPMLKKWQKQMDVKWL